jgi:hypothetical protein
MAEETALTPAEALARQVAVMREFLAEHPELATQLGVEIKPDAGPPVPLTIAHVVHELVDHIPGIDLERREQMHGAVDTHFRPPEPEKPGPTVIPGEVVDTEPAQAPAAPAQQALATGTDPAPGTVSA